MKRFRCVVFGCRVNQYEMQAIREQLQARGYAEAAQDERPDWVLVNSCTVTAAADRECLSLVRSLRRSDPAARIAITGCLVQRDADGLKRLPGVALLVGSGQKHQVGELIERIDQERYRVPDPVPGTGYSPLSISAFRGMQKAFVKVQDGCDRACAFCKIPYVRGRSRSRPLPEVLREVQRLVEAGFREVVLTGVAIGLWGRDANPTGSLASLVQALDALPGRFRVRLSSLDPRDLDRPLIQALAGSRRFCHHLHLSLQSGSDRVLERMNRGYTTGEYAGRVEQVRRHWPDLGLTTDVIAGFPGETEEMLRETEEFVRRMRFAKVHLFPFSLRRGTGAWFLDGRVEPRVVHERAKRLRRLIVEVEQEFAASLSGTAQEVLIEEEWKGTPGGYTGQFVRVRFQGHPAPVGELVEANLNLLKNKDLEAKILSVATLTK